MNTDTLSASPSSTHAATASPRHYLFMLPETVTPEEQAAVAREAVALAPEGYVYLASAHVKMMEDRGSIRYLPLHADRLPCFGEVAGVLVARDRALAQRAKEAYPGTPVMVFEPGDEAEVHEISPASAVERAVVRTMPPRPSPSDEDAGVTILRKAA